MRSSGAPLYLILPIPWRTCSMKSSYLIFGRVYLHQILLKNLLKFGIEHFMIILTVFIIISGDCFFFQWRFMHWNRLLTNQTLHWQKFKQFFFYGQKILHRGYMNFQSGVRHRVPLSVTRSVQCPSLCPLLKPPVCFQSVSNSTTPPLRDFSPSGHTFSIFFS